MPSRHYSLRGASSRLQRAFSIVLSTLESHSREAKQLNPPPIVLSEARSGPCRHVLQTPLHHQSLPLPRHHRREQLPPQPLQPPHSPQPDSLRAEPLHFEVLRVHQQRRSHLSRRLRSPPNHRAAHQNRKAPLRCRPAPRLYLTPSIASRGGCTTCCWRTCRCRWSRWSTRSSRCWPFRGDGDCEISTAP